MNYSKFHLTQMAANNISLQQQLRVRGSEIVSEELLHAGHPSEEKKDDWTGSTEGKGGKQKALKSR